MSKPTLSHSLIATSRQRSGACPEQWEGTLTDGRWFYFRYRYGSVSLTVGKTLAEVVGRSETFAHYGNRLDGSFVTDIERNELFAELIEELNCPL